MTTLQPQGLGNLGSAGEGIGHGVHHEGTAVAGVAGNIHRRGIRGDAIHAKKPLRKRNWDCVHGTPTLYAGFPHLFFYSNPAMAWNFLQKCSNDSIQPEAPVAEGV